MHVIFLLWALVPNDCQAIILTNENKIIERHGANMKDLVGHHYSINKYNAIFYVALAGLRYYINQTLNIMVSWHGNASALLALCEGNPLVTGSAVAQVLMFPLMSA